MPEKEASMLFPEERELVPYEAGFPPGNRWLFLAPHPDDETLGAGATLAQGVERGVRVRLIVVTGGEAQGRPSHRREEATRAAAILGIPEVQFWDFADRQLAFSRSLEPALRQAWQEFSPDLVFLPSPVELHPDHRALAWAAQKALRFGSWFGLRWVAPRWVAFYEVGSPLWPNLLVAADEAWERKQQAMACYASQLAFRPYGEVMDGLGAFRSLTLTGVSRAEAFRLVSTRQIARCSFATLQRWVALPEGRG
jgi:LmbE family N-acetylglucosaminyl deacetylase